MEEISNQSQKQGSSVNAIALISYLSFLCLVPILTKEKDEFVKFHAKQGLVLLICEVATWILSLIFVFVPIFYAIITILNVAWLVLSIIGIMNVVNNQKKELPVIGQFSGKINI